jgi:hypothetical protein
VNKPIVVQKIEKAFEGSKIPGYKQTPPDWCDDCNAAPGGECPDCGCTHNC